jgi:hypothetical protein
MSVNSPITAADGWFVGEDQDLQYTVSDSNGAIQDITGFTIQFKMGLQQGGTAVLTKSATLTTPAAGICTVSVASADTAALTPATYWYALSRTDTGQNQLLAYGLAVLQGRVS